MREITYKRILSPMELEILLWHYYSPCNYHDDKGTSEKAIDSSVWKLKELRLLELTNREGAERMYDVSERGKFYINALLSMPLPESKWFIPSIADGIEMQERACKP